MAWANEDLDRPFDSLVPEGSASLILGKGGTGKTTLGIQFLVEGAQNGDLRSSGKIHGLCYGGYDRPYGHLLSAANGSGKTQNFPAEKKKYPLRQFINRVGLSHRCG